VRAFEPLAIPGERVTLKPLRHRHAEGILVAADDEEVFEWLPFAQFTRLDEVRGWIEEALAEREADRRIPFVVEQSHDDLVVGSTSFRDLDLRNAKVEIGSTWFSRSSWGTGANLESKLLLMTYAFESLNLERVFIRADELNLRAQRAHEKLGAVKEGVHRHEVLRRDGSWCNSIHYSILSGEWPAAKLRLQAQLAEIQRGNRNQA
jgi:RimJ/RimL family protein N-acetyltransferase